MFVLIATNIFDWLVQGVQCFNMNLKKLHSIAAYVSSVRRLLSRTVACMREERVPYSKAEMDSQHADTFVLRRNCLVFAFIGRACDISPYYTDSNDSIKGVPINWGNCMDFTCWQRIVHCHVP